MRINSIMYLFNNGHGCVINDFKQLHIICGRRFPASAGIKNYCCISSTYISGLFDIPDIPLVISGLFDIPDIRLVISGLFDNRISGLAYPQGSKFYPEG